VPVRLRLIFFLAFLGLSTRVDAASIFIDFEALLEGDAVDGLVGPDVTFSNAMVLTAGSLLNDVDFPPKSGANVAADIGGPMRLDFATSLVSFSGFFTYAVPLTLEFFDAASNSLGTVPSALADNTLGNGGPANEPLSGAFAGAAFLLITGDPLGGSFVVDDISIETAAVVAPEPSTILLIGAGLAAVIRSRRRARRVAP
jgi:hypothetical protein